MPSPARAETGSTVAPGLIFPRSAVQRARSKSTWGSRSVLLTSTRPALRNMCGYLTGLSAPSVTEASTTRCASPRSNRAGQTRFPTFSITTTEPSGGFSAVRASRTIAASRWHPVPVLTCTTLQPAARIRSASSAVSWSPSMTPMTSSPARSLAVLSGSVVLPAPGELIRLSARMPRARSQSRFCRASSSLRASTFSPSVTVWVCQVPSSCWCRVPAPSAQPQVAHTSRHLDRDDLELLPAEHRDVRAPARAQHDRRIGLEAGAAGPAPALGGRLGDLQPGPRQAGALGGQVEAESDRVRHHAGQRADLQVHAGDRGAGQLLRDGVHHAFGDRQFVHTASRRGQQMRGSGSPTSRSTILVPPNVVLIVTSPTGSAVTSPMIAACAPSGW